MKRLEILLDDITHLKVDERVSFAGGSCDTYGRTGLPGRRAS